MSRLFAVISIAVLASAAAMPSFLEPATQCKKSSYAFCCEVGVPCDCTKGVTAPGQCEQASYAFCCSVGAPCDCSQPALLEAPSSSHCIHAESVNGTKKCYEACAESDFKSKGLTEAGACPIHYNTVDTTQVVAQCPDGVTNIKYCAKTALNVTMKSKGEAGICLHNEDAVDHKCYEACAFSEFKMKGFTGTGFCPDKYNAAESAKTSRQCPDGVTNLKYCEKTAVKVVMRTLGEK